MLTRVGLVLIHVDSCLTGVDSCWTRVDSCSFVLIRVDLCWRSCFKIDVIHNDGRSVLVKRFIKTLKGKIHKTITPNDSNLNLVI